MRSSFYKIVREDAIRVISSDLPWEYLSGAHILVTGASGFLGSNLLRTLLLLYQEGLVSHPLKVSALVRDVNRAKDRLSDLISIDHLHFIEWDLCEILTFDLGSPDYIIHAASQASPKLYQADPIGTILPNTQGTISLLKACPNVRRFLYISSAEVYGPPSTNSQIGETNFGPIDPTNLRFFYSESKRLGESICTAWHHQLGLHSIVVRLFHTYGPGIQSNDGRVFADFAYSVAHNKPLRITSDGTARRAFCYSSDAITGIFTALLRGQPAQAYNLGNPDSEVSILELAQMLKQEFSSYTSTIELSPCSPGYLPSSVNSVIPNIDRLKSIGWTPQIDILQGFHRFIQSIS